MRLRPTVILVGILGLALAACGGGGGKGSPVLPAAPSPTASSGSQTATKSHATFVITVPKTAPTPLGSKRPAYVSPATQSMTVSVLQGSTSVLSQTVGLTATSTGCTSSLANITCTLTLNLNAGTYTASITTYDGANGTGNQLSTAQNVSFTVAANQSSTVPLSLSGIPANIIAMAGNTADSVYVVAEDADGNFIVGPGAPTFVASPAPGSPDVVTITQPTTSTPNTITFVQPSPPVTGTETVGVTASYPSGQTNACTGSAVCTLAAPITVSYNHGAVFVSNYSGDNVLGWQIPLTSSTQSPSYAVSMPDPFPMTADANGNLFVSSYASTGGIDEISPPYDAITTSNTSGSDDPYGIAVAPNGAVGLANTGGSLAVYASPYTAAPTVNTTESFGQLYGIATDASNNFYVGSETTGLIYGIASPYSGSPFATVAASSDIYSMAAGSGKLFAAGDSFVDVFTLPLTNSSTPLVITSGISEVYGMAVDSNGDLWVSNYTGGSSVDGSIEEFTSLTAGASPAVTINLPAGSGSTSYRPWGLAFDSNGDLFVADVAGGGSGFGGLLEFTTPISSSSKPAFAIETGSLDYPYFVTVAGGSRLTVTP